MDYTKETQNGYQITGRLQSLDFTHIIMKRPNDYAIGYYYNESDGTWGSGRYGFKTHYEAFKELMQINI